MTRIAGLAGNRGRNLVHLADRSPGGAELAVVVTTDADAPALATADERAIPTEVVELGDEESRRDHERRVLDALSGYDFELVCLDGYMRVLSDTFLDAAPLTLNVHPSLLPAFPGMDAWGDALDAGAKVVGCTVHAVTDATDENAEVIEGEVDAGPIVTQEPVAVREGEDRESLKRRVLHEGEFAAYPRAVKWFAEDRLDVDWEENRVRVAGDDGGPFPARRIVTADRATELRYGENPHQDGALYVDATAREPNVAAAARLNPGAKRMGYNNYNDADAALNLVAEFDRPAAAVIKHTNPAGCATADTLADAYDRALGTDPKSAFGGVVGLNRRCDGPTADAIVDSFKEVVVAPGYTEAGLATLRGKDDLRVLDVRADTASGDSSVGPDGVGEAGDPDDNAERTAEKDIVGGTLVQERDLQAPTRADLEVVTDREPTDDQVESMLFAWRTVKHVKSNAVLFATGTETVGVGAGQVSRVDAVEIARRKAESDAEGKSADGSVMASDAFFPFPDAVDVAAEAGIEAVIQPGGSVNDDEVVAAANDHDMAMVFTGRRCFRHD